MKNTFLSFGLRPSFWVLLLTCGLLGAEVMISCSEGGGVNVFSVEDDIKLGRQLEAEIAADPVQYPVLSRTQYPEAYGHLQRITNNLLNTGKINYRDRFEWNIYIIRDDNTLNAFCAPGGYIYAYTGLIKFLDNESQFAGVMGHEIAHADLRHSTDRLTQQYGIQLLLDLVLGKNQGAIAQMASTLATLSYSRKNETQADEYSVDYLCSTNLYASNGTAGFFQKLVDSGQSGRTPQWLSTHPNPENRVENINSKANSLSGCSNGTFDSQYAAFKASLP